MIPPPPRSRFAALPRLPTGIEGGTEPSSASKKPRITSYTSVFQSPSKSAAVKQPTADTPSRLARFREANWIAKETKKRSREGEQDSAIQPPKSRIVTRLFVEEEEAPSNGEEQLSQAGELVEEDPKELLEKKLQVELALQEELVRDTARLSLRKDALGEEIDFLYNLLRVIETRAVEAAEAVNAARSQDDAMKDEKSSRTLKLSEGVQEIISAAKPREAIALEATPPVL